MEVLKELLLKFHNSFEEELKLRNEALYSKMSRKEYDKHDNYASVYLDVCEDLRKAIIKIENELC